MDETEIDRLANLAKDGDRAAASLLLVELMPRLAAVARREARRLIEPEDLQSYAVEKLLESWSQGRGPTSGIFPYLVRTMRNRVIDEARSPRSRTRNLYEAEDFTSTVDLDPAHSIELDQEKQWVQRALQHLEPGQRRLLIGIYSEGLKPAELAVELERTPNAIYSLHRRSKEALRRAILQEVLRDQAPELCRAAAKDLPDRIDNDLDDTTGNSAGMAHIKTCERCRSAWRRFGTITSALGIGGLLALTVEQPSVAAAFAAPGAVSEVQPPSQNAMPSHDPATPHPGTCGGEIYTETERTSSSPSTWKATIAWLVAGALAGLTGGVLLCQHAERMPEAPSGSLTMSVEHRDSIQVGVTFSVDDQDWVQEKFTLSYPAQLTPTRIPDGWDCAVTDTLISCNDPDERPVEGTFHFAGKPVLGDELGLQLEATSGPYVFRGYADSEVPPTDGAITTRADVRANDE